MLEFSQPKPPFRLFQRQANINERETKKRERRSNGVKRGKKEKRKGGKEERRKGGKKERKEDKKKSGGICCGGYKAVGKWGSQLSCFIINTN
jgi:hypothetical protein